MHDDRPTLPPALDELKMDSVRLDWAERTAFRAMLAAVEAHPPAADAMRRWHAVREERTTVQAKIDVLEMAMRNREEKGNG